MWVDMRCRYAKHSTDLLTVILYTAIITCWVIWCRIQSSRWYWRPGVLSFRKCHVISHRGWSSSFSTFTSDAHIWSSTLLTRYACLSIIDFKPKRHTKTKRKEFQLILFKYSIYNRRSCIFHYMIPNSLDIIDSRLLPVAMRIEQLISNRDMSRCLMLQGRVLRITINYLYIARRKTIASFINYRLRKFVILWCIDK